ncbi:MAG: hypothetical protein ACFFAQ_07105 [Promethearchaeota archaeon]
MNNKKIKTKISRNILEIEKLYRRLLKKKTVRICIYIEFIAFYPGLILAIMIAKNYSPIGYNLFQNYISDLGSVYFTPAPYIFNSIVIITSVITIPIFMYLEEVLCSTLNKNIKIILSSKSTKIITKIGKITFLLGSMGLFGIGIFNEDFPINQVHILFATLAFGGFTLGGVIAGFLIIMKKTIIPKLIGYYMTFYSLGLILLRLFHFLPLITLSFIEWSWFLGILIWLLPLTLTLLKHIDVKS